MAAVIAYWCGTAGQHVDVDYYTLLGDTLVVVDLEVGTQHHAVVESIVVVAGLEVAENRAVVECVVVVAGLEVAAEHHIGTLIVAGLEVAS